MVYARAPGEVVAEEPGNGAEGSRAKRRFNATVGVACWPSGWEARLEEEEVGVSGCPTACRTGGSPSGASPVTVGDVGASKPPHGGPLMQFHPTTPATVARAMKSTTRYGFLVASGWVAQKLGLLERLNQHLCIKQKTYTHSLADKVVEALVGILGNC